ncbi:MAG: hypothetical protein OK474_07495 [Thaumarchaeota archaeon]|nr:hypothetical protein [Nitrososphaerota archaeon]
MSVPTPRQAFAFLAPLRGRTSVFITPSRRRNSMVAHFLLGCLAASRMRTVIFDTSSFYATNIGALAESLPKDFLQRSTLITPQDDRRLEDSVTDVLEMKAEAILIDDLNALHYLISSDRRGGSGTHQLFTFIRLLSYQARTENLFVFGTVYKTERDSAPERTTRRSLSAAADLQITTTGTTDRSDRISFRCTQTISGWPDNRFSAPLYLEPRT